MKVGDAVHILAGSMILFSVTMTILFSQNWLFLTAFVGFNLIQSAFTGFCPAQIILGKLFFKTPAEQHLNQQ